MASAFASFVKRELNTDGVLILIIVLVVLTSVCTAILAVLLISDWYSTRRRTRGAKPNRPVSSMSEGSFWSPDARIQTTTLQGRGNPFRDDPLPPRPNRPPQPWGEADSYGPALAPTKSTPKQGLSAFPLKPFSMRRSQSSMHSQPPQLTDPSFIRPAMHILAAPEKALARDRTSRLPPTNAGGSRLPNEGEDGYRPLSRRAPFKKPHPFPVSIRRPPDPNGESEFDRPFSAIRHPSSPQGGIAPL